MTHGFGGFLLGVGCGEGAGFRVGAGPGFRHENQNFKLSEEPKYPKFL